MFAKSLLINIIREAKDTRDCKKELERMTKEGTELIDIIDTKLRSKNVGGDVEIVVDPANAADRPSARPNVGGTVTSTSINVNIAIFGKSYQADSSKNTRNLVSTQSPMGASFQRPQNQVKSSEFEHYNYQTLMRIESELYILFRTLTQFTSNDNFKSKYKCLLKLKRSLRSSLETLMEFSLLMCNNGRFAESKLDENFYK